MGAKLYSGAYTAPDTFGTRGEGRVTGAIGNADDYIS